MSKKTLFVLFVVISMFCSGCAKQDVELPDQLSEERYMHISIDDVIGIFADLTNNQEKYNSIFDNNILKFFKDMHEEFGAVFSLYCFFEGNGFDLSQSTDKFADEFFANSDWLKFGFHTIDGQSNYKDTTSDEAKNDYNLIINELIRITGGIDSIDAIPRLQNYAGNLESILAMRDANIGITGVLSADDDRNSYYFVGAENEFIFNHDQYIDDDNEIVVISTDIRLENYDKPYEELSSRFKNDNSEDTMGIIEVFTHESYLDSYKMKKKIKDMCKFAIEFGYDFDFPQNRN